MEPPNITPPKPLIDQWHEDSRQHLHDAGEHYGEHLGFTLRTGADLILTGLIIITHGLIPAFFTTTGSSRIERIYRTLRGRIGKSRAHEIDTDWQI